MKKKNIFKKIAICLSVVLAVACAAVDAWWISVKFYAPDKIVDNTIHASTVESVSGRTENIFEVNYYSNKNKNGLEMFELKTSYLTDTDGLDIHSQGIQYVANTASDSIEWQFGNFYGIGSYDEFKSSADSDDFWSRIVEPKDNVLSNNDNVSTVKGVRYDALFQKYLPNKNTSKRFDYASGDNFENEVYNSTNPLGAGSKLKITIKNEAGENEVFGMSFRGSRTGLEINNNAEKEEKNLLFTFYKGYEQKMFWTKDIYGKVYSYLDENFFAYKLYEAIKDEPSGTKQIMPLEFGDWFDYYTVNNGVLTDIKFQEEASGKVKQNVTSYFQIKVNVIADGAQRASDSMFGRVQGSPDFNLNGDDVGTEDYFYGRSIIDVKVRDFEALTFGDGHLLKLKEEFINRYIDYKGLIQLSVEIDMDTLAAEHINFLGFAPESGLEKFSVLKIYKVRTIDGEIHKEEVTL